MSKLESGLKRLFITIRKTLLIATCSTENSRWGKAIFFSTDEN